MTHSILLAYRNRPKLLQSFLSSFTSCRQSNYFDIILVDQQVTPSDETIEIIKPFTHLNVHYLRQIVPGPFHKTKALNAALQVARGEIITMVDVDCLFHHYWLAEMEMFFAVRELRTKKLAWTVCYIDANDTKEIERNPNYFYKQIIPREHQAFNQSEKVFWDAPVGCSHFSIAKNVLVENGGWHNGFVGYGLEDHELNLRLHQNGVQTHFAQTPIFHLWHERDWNDPDCIQKNHQLFEAAQRENFPRPENHLCLTR